jgi:hypothetical protein
MKMANQEVQQWTNGPTKADIQQYAQDEKIMWLANVYSGHSSDSVNNNKEQFVEKVDGLLRLFGINEDEWQGTIVGGRGTVTSEIGAIGVREYDARELKRWATGTRLGEFVMERAYWAVPIEGSEEQDGDFALTLELGSNIFATLRSEGEQEVYRYYIDPTTRERLEGDPDELKEKAIHGEADTDIAEIHTNINYSVVFSNSSRTPAVHESDL